MPVLPRPVVAVVLVTLVGGLAACSSAASDEGQQARSARVGESFVAQLSREIEGFSGAIVVPGRRYDLLVTSPRDHMDTVSAAEAEVDDAAADGTRFVAVTWDLSAAGGDAVALGGEGPEVSPELAVVVDGSPIEAGALDEEGVHARWVVVPEDAGEIGVAVTYDGLTQTIEDASDRAAPPEGGPDLLYAEDPPSVHHADCPEPVEGPEPARYVVGSCTVTVTDPFPYHRELGWADEGRAWVVVRLAVRPVVVGWDDPDPGGAVVDYETTNDEVEVTVDGAEPVDVLPSEADLPAGLQDDGAWAGDVVFSVPDVTTAFRLAFSRPYTALPTDPDEATAAGTPAELTGSYDGTFEVSVG